MKPPKNAVSSLRKDLANDFFKEFNPILKRETKLRHTELLALKVCPFIHM